MTEFELIANKAFAEISDPQETCNRFFRLSLRKQGDKAKDMIKEYLSRYNETITNNSIGRAAHHLIRLLKQHG